MLPGRSLGNLALDSCGHTPVCLRPYEKNKNRRPTMRNRTNAINTAIGQSWLSSLSVTQSLNKDKFFSRCHVYLFMNRNRISNPVGLSIAIANDERASSPLSLIWEMG
jgi:hypothetical protein